MSGGVDVSYDFGVSDLDNFNFDTTTADSDTATTTVGVTFTATASSALDEGHSDTEEPPVPSLPAVTVLVEDDVSTLLNEELKLEHFLPKDLLPTTSQEGSATHLDSDRRSRCDTRHPGAMTLYHKEEEDEELEVLEENQDEGGKEEQGEHDQKDAAHPPPVLSATSVVTQGQRSRGEGNEVSIPRGALSQGKSSDKLKGRSISFDAKIHIVEGDGLVIESAVQDHVTKFLHPNPQHIAMGPLMKKGNSKNPFGLKWKPRWFLLTPQGISYFETVADRKNPPLGVISMVDVDSVRTLPAAEVKQHKYHKQIKDKKTGNSRTPEQSFIFEVQTAMRSYYMSCSSEEMCIEWVSQISKLLNERKSKQ